MDGLYGNDNGHGQDISKSNGHDANRATVHSVAHSHPGEFAMSHLTLQEVIERINQTSPPAKDQPTTDNRTREQPHRPEFYGLPIAKRLASMFST